MRDLPSITDLIPPFVRDALCAQTDPEAFFPKKGGSVAAAKKICAACPVREECLQYALDNDERFGLWGGKSDRERRKMSRTRRCQYCSKPFEPGSSHARMCSDECRRRSQAESVAASKARQQGRAAA